jgi:hypothetical protein
MMNELKEKIINECAKINKKIYKRRAKKAVKKLTATEAIQIG